MNIEIAMVEIHQKHDNMKHHTKEKALAFWAITPKGASLADTLRKKMNHVTLFIPNKLSHEFQSIIAFESFQQTLNETFFKYDAHVFFMATGIVVRMISNFIKHKSLDPAVIVMDECGYNCISLLSGHIGGGNSLTNMLAEISGANPVITTATDVNKLLAIDIIASERDIFIENPEQIKAINMCILQQKPFWLYDPYGFIDNILNPGILKVAKSIQEGFAFLANSMPGIIVDDQTDSFSKSVLVLRPPTLSVGIGCNKNTEASEIINLFKSMMQEKKLAIRSVFQLASIDIKSNEPGLIEASKQLGIPLRFFDADSLNRVKEIQNPSEIVRQHVGVNSVCEASAILAAKQGKLIVMKQKSRNVTLAVAQTFSNIHKHPIHCLSQR